MSEAHKIAANKRWQDPVYRAKMSRLRKALWDNKLYVKHFMVARKKVLNSTEYHVNASKGQRRRFKDPEQRRLRSESQIKINSDPKLRERHKRKLVKYYSKRYNRKANQQRLLRSYANGGTKPGLCNDGVEIKTAKGGEIICHGNTGIELMFAMLLDMVEAVKKFKKDYPRISYVWKGLKRTFFPDYYVTLLTGEKLVIEFSTRTTKQDEAKFESAEKWCKKYGYTFLVSYSKDIDIDEMLNFIGG
jgi:hypothetical protein